jgi:hypothetical protein
MAGGSTLGSVRERLGFKPDTATFSLRKRFEQLGIGDESSVGFLLNAANPETKMHSKHLKAGDVSVNAELFVASNGEFQFRASLFDEGTLFGDKYSLFAGLANVAPDKSAFALSERGSLDDHENDSFSQIGNSPWLYENWNIAKNSAPSWLLRTSWDVEVKDVLLILVKGALVVGALFVGSKYKGHWEKNDTGGATYVIPLPDKEN